MTDNCIEELIFINRLYISVCFISGVNLPVLDGFPSFSCHLFLLITPEMTGLSSLREICLLSPMREILLCGLCRSGESHDQTWEKLWELRAFSQQQAEQTSGSGSHSPKASNSTNQPESDHCQTFPGQGNVHTARPTLEVHCATVSRRQSLGLEGLLICELGFD